MDAIGPALLSVAREAIGEAFGLVPLSALPPALAATGATFVTLRQAGDLRGCIGTVSAWRPLGEDVRANALGAAFHDPRFPPLVPRELDATSIEVSLLGPQEPLAVACEDDALRLLRPGIDGVVLTCGRRRATFLPQVWEQLPEPRSFLAALKQKAGLPGEFWSAELRLARYGVAKFEEAVAARTMQ